MRFSTASVALLAAAPSFVSATGTLGFSLGANNPDNSCKTREDYRKDLDAIYKETGSKLVRLYAGSQCNQTREILPVAKEKGFQVVLGIWTHPEESYQLDKNAIIKESKGFEDQVYAVTVGSETLYRKEFKGKELASKISDFKKTAPHFKVGTADTWNKFQDGTANDVIAVSDILLCNAFSYWQGQKMDNATASFYDDVMQAFGHIQSISGSTEKPELWVGETGWPTAGSNYQNAVPSVANSKRFYEEAICGMVAWGYKVFSFEAFDEPNKVNAVGEDGTEAPEGHWGVMDVNRKPKYNLKC